MLGGLVVLFILVGLGSTVAGFVLVRMSLRRRPDPPVPVARDANPSTARQLGGKARRFVTAILRAARFVVGLTLIIVPWWIVYAILTYKPPHSESKGRVLRIRNRARLPQPAHGAGWSQPDVTIAIAYDDRERAVLGELWLLTARMEHASIAAFAQLSIQLAALGAPSELVERTHRAALEEIGHARRCFAIAGAITGEPHRAGPIVELAQARATSIDLVRLAIGSLVDGCVAEGTAADVAARAASTADEPTIRGTLELIAHEEAGHAELAWDVLAWCLDEGGATVERAVAARVEILTREIAPRMPDLAGIEEHAMARHGIVGQDALGELSRARVAAVQARARLLLAREAKPIARAA